MRHSERKVTALVLQKCATQHEAWADPIGSLPFIRDRSYQPRSRSATDDNCRISNFRCHRHRRRDHPSTQAKPKPAMDTALRPSHCSRHFRPCVHRASAGVACRQSARRLQLAACGLRLDHDGSRPQTLRMSCRALWSLPIGSVNRSQSAKWSKTRLVCINVSRLLICVSVLSCEPGISRWVCVQS